MISECDHMCHTVGLNPWVEVCPVCGCSNEKYDPNIPIPETLEELLNWNGPPDQWVDEHKD